MSWYADQPLLRTRQMLYDAAVVVWTVAWVMLARLVHDLVAALAGPARSAQDAGVRFEEAMRVASTRITDLPVVGGHLGDALGQVAGTGETLASAGSRTATTIEQLALVLAVVCAAGPILTVLIPWVSRRLQFARQSAATRKLIASGYGTDLFALRALATRPAADLLRISADPIRAWRSQDPAVIQRLASLEVRDSGVKLPR